MKVSDKIAVCVQPDTSGPIGLRGAASKAIRDMGLNKARIRCPKVAGTDSWRRGLYQGLVKDGIDVILTHNPGRSVADEVADMATLNVIRPGCIIAYEGPNEPDLNPVSYAGLTDPRRVGSQWRKADAALALTKAMRDELRRDPAFASVKVLAFNDWFQKAQAPFTSMANTHIYPTAGKTLSDYWATMQSRMREHGRGAILPTEFGYTNGAGQYFDEVSEEQAAANIAKDIAFIMSRPQIFMASIYTLVDAPGEREFNRFGLYNDDWTMKPAAKAVAAA